MRPFNFAGLLALALTALLILVACSDSKTSTGVSLERHHQAEGLEGLNNTVRLLTTTAPTAICGNSSLEEGEQCDTADSTTCLNCNLVLAKGAPVATDYCGNAVTEPSEQCDDGNDGNEDTCTQYCKFAICGDGYVQRSNGEVCDDKRNGIENDACTDSCQAPTSQRATTIDCEGSQCVVPLPADLAPTRTNTSPAALIKQAKQVKQNKQDRPSSLISLCDIECTEGCMSEQNVLNNFGSCESRLVDDTTDKICSKVFAPLEVCGEESSPAPTAGGSSSASSSSSSSASSSSSSSSSSGGWEMLVGCAAEYSRCGDDAGVQQSTVYAACQTRLADEWRVQFGSSYCLKCDGTVCSDEGQDARTMADSLCSFEYNQCLK